MILIREGICQLLIIMSWNKTHTKTYWKILSSHKCLLLKNRNQEKGTKPSSLEEILKFLHSLRDW